MNFLCEYLSQFFFGDIPYVLMYLLNVEANVRIQLGHIVVTVFLIPPRT